MTRCLVVAPGATVVSIIEPARGVDSTFGEIVRQLEAAEERLAALLPKTQDVEPHLDVVREIRAQMTARTGGAELATATR